MTTHKPRHSVLSMFDPLQAAPSTPRRDSSPESGSSDKENDGPAPGELTVFFNRMYKQPQQVQKTPSGKLIDFDESILLEDGTDADGEQSEGEDDRDMVVAPLPLTARATLQRVPFADIELDDTPKAGKVLPASIFAAPYASPLTSVINSINLSSLSLSDSEGPDPSPTAAYRPQPAFALGETSSSPVPAINVCPETPILPEFDVGGPRDLADIPVEGHAMGTASLRPQRTLTPLGSDDPRRTSIDLHSSFQLQIASEEMSFDLLNDKISFLGHQDSFWASGVEPEADEQMDFDQVDVPPMSPREKTVFGTVFGADSYVKNALPSPPLKAHLWDDPADSEPFYPPVTPRASPRPSLTPPSSGHSDKVYQAAIHEPLPPSPPLSPVSLHEDSLLLETEPFEPPMRPIPALRIVKKTFKLTGRQSAAPRVSNIMPPPASAPADPPVLAPKPSHPATVIRGVQRPPPGVQFGNLVIRPPSTSSSSSSSTHARESAATTAPTSRFAAAGIKRPKTAAAAKEQAVPVVRSISASATGGTFKRPALPGLGKPAPAAARTMSGSATLGKVARLVSGSSKTTGPPSTSALPRPPASRLPGPSSLPKVTLPGSLRGRTISKIGGGRT